MIKKIMNKAKEEKGNAVIILGLILIMVCLFVGGMLLDISKAHQMKSSYIDSATTAVQAGIRQQNSSGYLTAEAAAQAILVYENVARPSVIKPGYMSSCDNPRRVEINVYYMGDKFAKGAHKITINSSNVSPSDTIQNILTKAKLNGQSITPARKKYIEDGKYTGLEIELTESTPNVILPGATTISGLDGSNLKCQQLGIQAGASQYEEIR